MAVKKTYVNIEAYIYRLVIMKDIDIIEAILLSDIEYFNKGKGYFKKNDVIANELNISKETVSRKLSNLEEKDYIIRTQIFRGRLIKTSQKFIDYQHSQIDDLDNQPSQNDVVPSQNGMVKPSQIDEANNKNKNYKNKSKNIIENYFDNNKVNILFNDFLKNRIELFGKKVNTNLSIKKLVNKLSNYSDEDKIEMLDVAILRGYRDVFKSNEPKKKNSVQNNDYLDSL